ncbi:hypothetical protein B6N60_00138 [Richelia sinica FACHB-800]|uniref:Uncharacterized protein n=1 Tax=Richelia sinica FACHB-800 TaxID=1357546 RepID=A0A975Y2U9_9NOST|nr:hypothetical protein B6N60_00138 [Richelia sinica FACHB-800]
MAVTVLVPTALQKFTNNQAPYNVLVVPLLNYLIL